jgi:UDP-MurNAc hydroxylase
MKLTNIGGATAILEHDGKRMLFDPWLDDGIFHGAWYHYPPLEVGIEDLGRFDYIYISHVHEDHCSIGTIERLNRDAEIILIDREPNFVRKFFDNHGLQFKKIHLVKPYHATPIAPGLAVDMLEADPTHEANYLIDSALVLNWDGFVLYNSNDCPPCEGALAYLQRNYPKVNAALLPYSGGSGYPACFTNLSHDKKLAEKQRIYKEGLRRFVDTVQALQPDYAMPFADQYVVAGSRSHLNPYLPHPPDGAVVLDALERIEMGDRALLLNSGQSFDFLTGEKKPDVPYRRHSEEDREQYIKSRLADKRYDHEAFALDHRVSLGRLIESARARLWSAQKREDYFPSFTYYIDAADRNRRFAIRLDQEKVLEGNLETPCEPPYLRVSAPSTLLALLALGHVSWNIADAALFLDYERVPNQYDPKLHASLNYLTI